MPSNKPLRQKLAFWICVALIVALLYSKFVLTLGMIGLVLLSILDEQDHKLSLASTTTLKDRWFTFLRRKDFLVITFFFFIVLCSGIYSSDLEYWAERLRIKLPFLLLPFAFASLPAFSYRQYAGLFYCFLITVSISTIPVGLNYALNFEAINQSIGMGKAIPTPINHIRYSLLLSFAVLSGIILWWRKFHWRNQRERTLILCLSLYLFVFLHLLSVRSGLVVLYISILVLGLRFIFYSRRYLLGTFLMLCLAALPIIAFYTIPSLQQKIRYTLYDYDQYRKGNIDNLSDSERLISIEAGLVLASQNPLWGKGAGDLKKEVKRYYQTFYPNISHPKLPHNQFVSVLAGTGIIGFTFFLFAFLFPLKYHHNYRDDFLLVLHVIVFFSFLVENTIENAIGVAFYALFLLVGLNQKNSSTKITTE